MTFSPRTPWSRSGLAALALVEAAAFAHAGVMLTPQAGRLISGQQLTFRAQQVLAPSPKKRGREDQDDRKLPKKARRDVPDGKDVVMDAGDGKAPEGGMVETVVGPSGPDEIRCGLLSKGRPGPLPPDHAAVADPRGLLALGLLRNHTLVATGACLTSILNTHTYSAAAEVACPAAAQGEACAIRIKLGAQDPAYQINLPGQALTYAVQFIEADGTAQEELALGKAIRGLPETVQATFTQAGAARSKYITISGNKAPVAEAVPDTSAGADSKSNQAI